MGTTSMSMARRVVQLLQEQGVVLALLHSFDLWEQGILSSDVDLVVDRPLSDLAPGFFRALILAGCFPIVVWNYDLDASSIFVVDSSGDRGVQIDLNYDDRGAGRYGLRSGAVLERIDSSTTPPRVDDVDEWLYSTRKRLLKRQSDRARELLARRPDTVEVLEHRASEIFSPRAARSVHAAMRTGRLLEGRLPREVTSYPRLAGRAMRKVLRPTGFWVDLRGTPDEIARARTHFEGRFTKILPRVVVLSGTRTHQTTLMPHAIIVRLKPSLVISNGLQHPFAPVDLALVVDSDLGRTTSNLVRAMAARYP